MRGRKAPVWIGLCALLAMLACLPSQQTSRQIPAPKERVPHAESVGPQAAVPQQRAAAEKALPGLAAAPVRFTVLFFNDLHGYLLPFTVKQADGTKTEVGGIARMATLIKRIRAENDCLGRQTMVLVAGDILQGTPMSTVFHGEPDVEALNASGVNGLAVGNHEFDFGLENFQSLRQRARFTFISSNLVWKDSGRTVCDPALSLPVTDKVSLTVIGATTDQLLTSTKPDNVVLLNVVDPVTTVREAYERGKQQGPVILLSHSKAEADEEVARAVPGLLAIVGGHDQILLNPCKQVGPVFIFQAFEKGRYL
jgi:5'-nucleotidase / UDP-sugar diphosphatase